MHLYAPVGQYDELSRMSRRLDRKAREAPIANAIGAPSNTASRDASAIEYHRIFESGPFKKRGGWTDDRRQGVGCPQSRLLMV